MSEIASAGQLRMSYLRWAMVTVPAMLLIGFLSSSLAPSGSDSAWYVALQKPDLNPPDWVFPVVWTSLYILMGLALAMILNARRARGKGVALTLFAVQIAANFVWSPTFFGAHRIGLALGLIGVMLVFSIAATFAFARIRKGAAWLMLPYLVWISFAGVLNWRIGELNPNAETLVPAESSTQILL